MEVEFEGGNKGDGGGEEEERFDIWAEGEDRKSS